VNNNATNLRSQDLSQRQRVERIIFGTETPLGRLFDLTLLLCIVTSVGIVMLDSIADIHGTYGSLLFQVEIGFTLVFTIEYLTRIWCVHNRRHYVLSFWGIIDLLSILPTYLALVLPEAAPLMVIRVLRVLRVFRVLRLFELMREFNEIVLVLRNSARAIFVFFALVIVLVIVFGCILYVLEGPEHGFTSIPLSIYWAVVTIATVGYGDIVPQTGAGKGVAMLGILLGYSILAVPTAIITSKLWERLSRRQQSLLNWNCPVCARTGHSDDANYCKYCGSELDVPEELRTTTAEAPER
jgi:voltage-gated potassium channel